MKIKTFLLAFSIWLLGSSTVFAVPVDYTNDKTYKALYDAMHHAFNDGDSAKFFPAVQALQQYLFDKNDLHGYYTQRCNEIVFQMNQQRIYEAYKLARELSKELREKKVDKEMYMAMNMLGHINRYCGNKEEAKDNWREVLRLMQEHGYYSSMPPIYMNIVNVALDDSPEEADSLLEIAKQISLKHCPERVFDIETRRTLSYYYRGDFDRFLKGYEEYKKGEAIGKSSVHGRSIEVFHEALLGHTDEAVRMAREELGDEGLDAITIIYEKAGRWKDAFDALKNQTAANDSIDNVVLTNSMRGIRDEMMIYEAERDVARTRFYLMSAVIVLLALLVGGLFYITMSRRMAAMYQPRVVEDIERCWSSAAFWYEYMALQPLLYPDGPRELLLEGLTFHSLQGDRIVADIYAAHFGVKTTFTSDGAIIVNNTNHQSKVDCQLLNRQLVLDFTNCPDLYPAIALTCERLGVPLIATGAERLAYKESNRLEAVALHQVRHDHRMAMALLVAGYPVDDTACIAKSYPSFLSQWLTVTKANE